MDQKQVIKSLKQACNAVLNVALAVTLRLLGAIFGAALAALGLMTWIAFAETDTVSLGSSIQAAFSGKLTVTAAWTALAIIPLIAWVSNIIVRRKAKKKPQTETKD